MVVRLFLGGLPHDISAADLRSRFNPFGKVESIDIIPPKDNQITTAAVPTSTQTSNGPTCRGFAYIELDPKDEVSIHKCLSVYNNSKWRGNVLRVELAKPSYLARLHVEWQEQARLEEQQPRQLLQNPQQPVDHGSWFLPTSAKAAAPTRPPCAMPSQAMRPLPPPEVSAASLAAATAAAEAAAAKRTKAAARSSRPTGPVPPPAPADLSQPLSLPNPHNHRHPIEVNLAQPAKLPRRSFPAVIPLPLSCLEWQRDDDFGEQLRAFNDEDEDEDESDNGDDSTGGGIITGNRPSRPPSTAPPLNDGGAVARPPKRSRIELPVAAAEAPSVLYYLNRVWAQPMRPYTPSAVSDGVVLAAQAAVGTISHSGVGATVPPKQPGFLQTHVEHVQEQDQEAAMGDKGSTKLLRLQGRNGPVAAAGAAAVLTGDANEAAAAAAAGSRQLPHALPAPAPGAKREVRGEMLSMFKVLKAIDSETRKRSAEEAAAARAAEARAATAVGSRKGSKEAKQQEQKMMMALRGQAIVSAPAMVAGGDVGSEEGGDRVVNFLEEGDADRTEMAGSRLMQEQELMLDKFDDSDGKSEDFGDVSVDSDGDGEVFHRVKKGSGGPRGRTAFAARTILDGGGSGSNRRDAKVNAGGKTAKASSTGVAASQPPSPRVQPMAEPKVPRVAPPSAQPMAEPKVPRVAPPSAQPMAEPKVPRVPPPSAQPMAEPKVPRVAPPSAQPGPHSQQAKRFREVSDAAEEGGTGCGAAAGQRSAASRRLSAPPADVPLVPLGPQRGRAPGGRKGGSPAEDLLARFGGDSNSDCEEVFRDVDSADSEVEGVSGRVWGRPAQVAAATNAAAAGFASKQQADQPSMGWVSFLDDVEDGFRGADSGGMKGGTVDKRKVIGTGDAGGHRRQSGGRGRAGGGRRMGTPARTGNDSIHKGELRPPVTPAVEPHAGDGHDSYGSQDAKVLEAAGKQGPASAPPSSLLARQQQQPVSGGPLLATSFVRPTGCSDEELRAAWMASFGGLVEGARDNARTAQRAIQGRAGSGGARRGPGPRRR
ncbi:hypothetical protein Vretimale_11605 [Volvox reticuliferus]|uniref:RRM domain-containing protein n=1 Tax=Volvox reticuliferus TaxID=1737510 RepID=A0A8J4GHN9_9CHLO|nr:hypothetical protein Vretimale_11605 [Volvox reticuliferus]